MKEELNSIEFKSDITSNENELTRLRSLSNEVKQFSPALEKIETLKKYLIQPIEVMTSGTTRALTDAELKDETFNDINRAYQELFSSLNSLCASLKIKQSQLESLKEFNGAIQDELRYLSEMEDIELNRDWSQPKKMKSSELIQHKLVSFLLGFFI